MENLEPIPDYAVAVLASPEDRPLLDPTIWTSRGSTLLVHWPLQEWHTFSRANLRKLIKEPQVWKTLLPFYVFRTPVGQNPDKWPLRNEFIWFTREPVE